MRKRMVCGIFAAYLCLLVIIISLCNHSREFPWHERYQVICHALGSTAEGVGLTNSREAFVYNYRRGQRVFEADIQITKDGVMVLRHDWDSDLGQEEAFGWTEDRRGPVTEEAFLNAPIYGQYTPLTLEDWFGIMKTHPDIWLVTDTKYSPEVEKQFRLFVDTAVENGYEDVLSRVIVQIYYKEMYDEVRAVYPFENILLTLYYIGYPLGEAGEAEALKDFMAGNGIPVLTMPSGWWSEEIEKDLADSGIKVFVHTVNDEAEARQRLTEGISGIYTDVILPAEFERWRQETKERESVITGD